MLFNFFTHDWSDNQTNKTSQFDQDIHGWARSIFKWITNGISCNCCFVRVRTFVGHFAVDHNTSFKRFFSVIPGATSVVLEDGPKDTRNSNTGHITTKYLSSHFPVTRNKSGSQTNQDWRKNSQCTRKHHFAKCSFGRDFYTFAVLWLSSSFHNSWNFAELTTYFVHHIHSSATYRFHCQGRENDRNHAADKQGS